MRSLLLLIVLMLATPSFAAESAIDACARLAAHSAEDGRPKGVAIEDIDIAAALPACRAAHEADPASLPTTYRLGRVLQAAGEYVESTQLYRKAGAGGFAMGQVAYARALANGRGTPQNHASSFEWIMRAAEQNHPLGLLDAAYNYRDGVGTDYDFDRAIELFKAAAQLGEAEAERALGDIYRYPVFQRVDTAASAAHYQRAIALGSAFAYLSYGELLRCDCEQRDLALAVRQFEAAADNGVVDAVTYLAFAYWRGEGVEPNDTEALRLFRLADKQGDYAAAYYIGDFYAHGRGVTADQMEAEKWWRKAAEAGMRTAQHALGRLYLMNPGPDGRRNDGIIWLERAASAGVAAAYWDLFSYYTSIPVNDLDRAYDIGLSASYSPYPEIAEQGRSMMKSVLRMKQTRGLEPKPEPLANGLG